MHTVKHLDFAKPADVGLCPDRTQRLMDVLRREVASGRLPGAATIQNNLDRTNTPHR